MEGKERRVIIIGGGITGIATAYYLKRHQINYKRKFEIILIEKEDRWGGNIISIRDNGFLIEGGPDCFLTEKPWALNLSKEIGLEKRFVGTNDKYRRIFILSQGKLKELPEGFSFLVPTKLLPFLKNNLISLPGKLRFLMELFIPKKNLSKQESFSDFVLRRFGKEILKKIAEPMVSSIYVTDPDRMCIESTFPNLLDMEKKYGSVLRGVLKRKKIMSEMENKDRSKRLSMFMTFKDGMEELVNSLVSYLDKKFLIKNSTVLKVKRDFQNSKFQIKLKDGKELTGDAVVIATPAYVAGNLLNEFDKNLSDILFDIPYVSTATISLGYNRKEIGKDLDGFGFLVPCIEKRKIMACTFCSNKFKGRAPEDKFLLRCFIGGYKEDNLITLNNDALLKIVQKELKDIIGINAVPIIAHIYKWEKAMPQYILNHKNKLKKIEEILERYHGLFLTGSGYRGIGIPDCINEAAYISDKVINFLFPR